MTGRQPELVRVRDGLRSSNVAGDVARNSEADFLQNGRNSCSCSDLKPLTLALLVRNGGFQALSVLAARLGNGLGTTGGPSCSVAALSRKSLAGFARTRVSCYYVRRKKHCFTFGGLLVEIIYSCTYIGLS